MTYVDLGRYTAKTGADLTGQNIGNLTSVLDLSAIQVPYFEMYRLLISTSTIPAGLPNVIQSTNAQQFSSLTTLNLTFAKPATVGSTIVMWTGANATTTSPTQSAATIGGIADHFGNIAGASAAPNQQNISCWVCPATTQASAALVATFTGGVGAPGIQGIAYELGNMLNTTSAAAAVDQSAVVTSAASANLSTPVKVTTAANEFMCGFATEFNGNGIPSMSTGTTTPSLMNLPQVSGTPALGAFFSSLSSFGNVSLTGTNEIYNSISTQSGSLSAAMVSLFPAAGAGSAIALPFTVAVDGKIWDNQSTVPGVGYTYNMLQPLSLNEGNSIQIFWTSLTTAQYLSYAGQFSIQAWFRYDPSIQRRG